MKNTIFFAYKGKEQGFSDGNVDAIKSAIQEYNKHQKTYHACSWEDFRKTTLISKEILQAIRESEIFHSAKKSVGFRVNGRLRRP